MPGVMLDIGAEDLSFASDTAASIYNSSSPLCSPLPMAQHSHSPHSVLQQASARRSSSFNGRGHDTFAQLAPLSYSRSQSMINTSAIPQAFGNYYSMPSTPNKLSEMAMLEGLDDLDCGPVSPGMGDGGFGSLDAGMLSGASYLSDLRPGMGEGLHSPSSASRGMPTSPTSLENQQMLTALQKFLLNNNNSEEDESWAAVDVYACDEFRMFEFKVRRCMRGRSHDWTECPFAHPGEKARRRDPRRFHYSGTACPDFRKGSCRRGDACEFAHGVFECWLHPARYRTQPCKDGRSCRRRVCFFAHTQEQLRLLPGAAQAASVARNVLSSSQASALAACLSQTGASLSGFESSSPRYDGSPRTSVAGTFDGGVSFDGSRSLAQCGYDGVGLNASSLCGQYGSFNDGSVGHCCASQVSSPTSTLVGHTLSPPPLSPPLSPSASPVSPSSPHSWPSAFVQHSSSSLAQHASSNLMQHTSSKGMSDLIATLQQLDLRGGGVSPLWLQAQAHQVAAQSAQYSSGPSPLRRCSQSVPCTPTKLRWEGKDQQKHPWEVQDVDDDEQNVQRVVSGRDLRSKMYGKLGKENRMDGGEAPDLGWVNELVQEDPDQNW